MKNTVFIWVLLLLAAPWGKASAQGKHTLHYQGIARNAQGHPLASTTIAIRLSIKDDLQAGNILYSETKSVATNAFGMYSLSIGDGTGTQTGNFDNISWVAGSRFLMTEIDPANGSAFVNMGTAMLQSVPNAISAKTLEGVTNPQNGDLLEYSNGSWKSKSAPRRYTASGLGFNPIESIYFIGPTISFTAEKPNPKILMHFCKSLGTVGISGGAKHLRLNLGYKKSGGQITEFDGSKRIVGVSLSDGSRIPFTLLDFVQTNFEAGATYEVGIVGYAVESYRWNNNDMGSAFIEVSY